MRFTIILCIENCNIVTSNTYRKLTYYQIISPNGRVELRVNYLAIISFSRIDKWACVGVGGQIPVLFSLREQMPDGEQKCAQSYLRYRTFIFYNWGTETSRPLHSCSYWITELTIILFYCSACSGMRNGISVVWLSCMVSKRKRFLPTSDLYHAWLLILKK